MIDSGEKNLDPGQLGEQFVGHWLRSQNWNLLHHRWRCPTGEIDLIATSPSTLAFVEVKTRSRGNWDADGLLAITAQKQAKIRQTAEQFLATYPDWAEFPCRFDVALVRYQKLTTTSSDFCPPIALNQPILWAGYRLTLQDYIPGAF